MGFVAIITRYPRAMRIDVQIVSPATVALTSEF